ncbi:MAG: hypothetical protein EZS28_025773, partial [Streblomastix strix]
MESEGITDRKDKASIVPGEEIVTINYNILNPQETEFFNKLTFETVQIGRLHAEGWNDSNDLQDMEFQRSGGTLPLRVQLQMEQSQIIYPPTNTSTKQSITENEVGQSSGNSNSTDLAGTIVVHQTMKFILRVLFPWIIRKDSRDWTENERQGSKASTRQCGLHPSGSVGYVVRDLLMICMKMRGFSEEGGNLLFKGQRFKKVKRNFQSLALLQDWLDIVRIITEEMMNKFVKVTLKEVIAFHTRQNNSVASAKSHKACLTT